MARVVLKDLCKNFGSHQAVKSVNLTIEDGELVVFVGPSGCGKTTALRMIAGLEDVSSGEIWIGDKTVTRLEPKDRNVAMVFQNYALYPHKTVYNNLAFGLEMRRESPEEIKRRVIWASGILGLEELLERKPKQLSGGQMQRVALGRALVRKPDVFLLDEPLSNLDAKLRVRMREEIATLHAKVGVSMVYVTHDQVEAMTLGDRIVVMRDGVVQQVGTPLELYDKPTNMFVGGFIGSPEMNTIQGCIENGAFVGGGLKMPLDTFPFDLTANDGDAVVLGIRAEHMRIADENEADAVYSIRVIEQLGSHTLVAAELNGVTLRVLMDREDSLVKGGPIRLLLDKSRLHLFSASTTQSLRG